MTLVFGALEPLPFPWKRSAKGKNHGMHAGFPHFDL